MSAASVSCRPRFSPLASGCCAAAEAATPEERGSGGSMNVFEPLPLSREGSCPRAGTSAAASAHCCGLLARQGTGAWLSFPLAAGSAACAGFLGCTKEAFGAGAAMSLGCSSSLSNPLVTLLSPLPLPARPGCFCAAAPPLPCVFRLPERCRGSPVPGLPGGAARAAGPCLATAALPSCAGGWAASAAASARLSAAARMSVSSFLCSSCARTVRMSPGVRCSMSAYAAQTPNAHRAFCACMQPTPQHADFLLQHQLHKCLLKAPRMHSTGGVSS
jgi:hypothetical protein